MFLLMEKLFFPIVSLIALLLIFLGTVRDLDPERTMFFVKPVGFIVIVSALAIIINEVISFKKMNINETIRKINIHRNVIFTVVFSIIYLFLFEYLGYILSTFVILFLFTLVLGGNWKITLAISVILSVGLFYLFAIILYLPLPLGILRNTSLF